jgi:hypothetical protein
MTAEIANTITLREVARRLAQLPGSPPGKIADGKLLGLLKSGELSAGFFFPGRVVLWITIPTYYWANISSYSFRSIRRSDDDERQIGTYRVRITKFADEYANALSRMLQQNQDNDAVGQTNGLFLSEFKSALSQAYRRFEVLLPESEWASYLQRHNLEVLGPATKSKPGRREKQGWRRLSVIIGAYLIKHCRQTPEVIKSELAAEKIHEIAVKEKIPDLPATSTIKDVLSEIRSKAEVISIN